MSEHVDVVIVGARCAGAALGTFLARAGVRVVLVDRDPLPSDQVLSTHTIHPPGIDILDELGVGEAVRAVAPPSPRFRVVKGDGYADLRFEDGRSEYCPRRERLDGLLQDAAAEAGAQLRDRTRVTQVLAGPEGRVGGVRVTTSDTTEDLYADLVVGADGRHSLVAEQVGAEEYLGYDAPRAMYWAYWDAPDEWQSDRYPFDLYIAHRDEHVRVLFQTDHDQLLIGSLPPVEEGRSWRTDPLEGLRSSLAGDPVTASLVGGTTPDGQVRGTVKERYFFRRGAGDGWALVGDAGHHKEFVIGDGITEALIQAKSLSDAIIAEDDPGLVRWWRARDVEALPGYFWGRDDGAVGAPGLLQSIIVGRIASDPALQKRMTTLPEHRGSPYDALPMSVVLGSLVGALGRGQFGVVPEFLRQGRRASEYQREFKERTRLLAQASA